jgi:hypothetical protein
MSTNVLLCQYIMSFGITPLPNTFHFLHGSIPEIYLPAIQVLPRPHLAASDQELDHV